MTQIQALDNTRWLTMKEAAAFGGCTPKHLLKKVKNNMHHISDHVKSANKQGVKVYISHEGLTILRNIINVKKGSSSTLLDKGKEMIARKSIENADVNKLMELVYKLVEDVNELKKTKSMAIQARELSAELLPPPIKKCQKST